MQDEWNLSDKIEWNDYNCLSVESVREFIRRLKEHIKIKADEFLQKENLSLEEWNYPLPLIELVDKLAGDKLVDKSYEDDTKYLSADEVLDLEGRN